MSVGEREAGFVERCLTAAAALLIGLALGASPASAYRAYVANYDPGSVSVIDTATNQVNASSIGVGSNPVGLAIMPDASHVYVANQDETFVSRISTATNALAGSGIELGGSPNDVAISPDGTRAYASTFITGTNTNLTVIDTTTNAILTTIPFGTRQPNQIAITPDGSKAYVSNAVGSTVSVVDLATNAIVGSDIAMPLGPEGIAITPDGSKAYVANNSDDSVSVIDTAIDAIVGSPISVGSGPEEVAITPDGSRAYVTNDGGTVSVIDTATDALAGPDIALGGSAYPQGIAITPDGAQAWVATGVGHGVAVIDTATDSLSATIPLPGRTPFDLAIANLAGGGSSSLPPPEKSKTVNVKPAGGSVKTKCKGDSTFTPLTGPTQIPVGCLVDTTRGTVELTSAADTRGHNQSARFRYGLFRVTQGKAKGAFTDLKLFDTGGCGARSGRAGAARGPTAIAAGKKKGKLWGKGKGKFRVKGSKGSGSARGTTWQVTDRCSGKTEIRSIKGRVTARDFVRRRTVILKTGQRYLAPGPRGRRG